MNSIISSTEHPVYEILFIFFPNKNVNKEKILGFLLI